MTNLLKPDMVTYLFVFVTLLWWLEFLIFKNKSSQTDENIKNDEFSFYLILAAIVFPLMISLLLYFLDLGNLKYSTALVFRNIGIVIYIIGISIRYWSLISLGNYFKRDVEVQDSQPLISSGPYRVIRHPSYTGLLLLNIGLHFFIGNLPGIIISIISILIALHIRILEEEQSMEDVIGERYYNWKIERNRLFPWIY